MVTGTLIFYDNTEVTFTMGPPPYQYLDVVGGIHARRCHIILDWAGYTPPAVGERVSLILYLGSRSYSWLSASGINPTTNLAVEYEGPNVYVRVQN